MPSLSHPCQPIFNQVNCIIMKLKLEPLIQRVAIWLLVSSFFMVIGEILWDATLAQTAVSAGIFGLVLFLRLDLFTERGANIIDEIKSDDGIVAATIVDRTDQVGEVYIAKVTRNYQEGVFAREKEFDQLQDAKEWLTTTYQLELEKHQQRLREQPNH